MQAVGDTGALRLWLLAGQLGATFEALSSLRGDVQVQLLTWIVPAPASPRHPTITQSTEKAQSVPHEGKGAVVAADRDSGVASQLDRVRIDARGFT